VDEHVAGGRHRRGLGRELEQVLAVVVPADWKPAVVERGRVERIP
jgi:hypothetical protein